MNNRKILVLALVFVLVAGALFAQTIKPITDLQRGVEEFSSAMAKALPFNSTMGLNWSDAYIGQIVGAPPHFGAGIFLGSTVLDSGDIKTLANAMYSNVPGGYSRLPYPGFGAEGRIGGFLLPFDAGVKIAVLPSVSDDFDLHHFMVGGDIRYAILKGNAAMPKLSLGVGFNYMNGGIGIDIPGSQTYNIPTLSKTLELANPRAEFTWQTLTLDIKAQISKTFLIVTPYLGAGLTHGWSKAGYEITSNLDYDSTGTIDDAAKIAINNELKGLGLEPLDFDGTSGFSSIIKNTQWGMRLFGGVAFNLSVIKIDLSGLYNFNDQSFGVTLGTRFQM